MRLDKGIEDINMDLENKIRYGTFSDITGNKPIFIYENKNDAMDFCYSQNKNLYPKEVMILSPLYCFIRKVEVNHNGDVVRIIEKWKDRKFKNVEEE